MWWGQQWTESGLSDVGKVVEKSECLHTVGGNGNQYNLYGKQYGVFSKNSK